MIQHIGVYFIFLFYSFINIIIPISGSATVTPWLAVITDAHTAIGLATFYFLLTCVVRIYLFREHIRWSYVKELWPLSIIGASLAAFSLVTIQSNILLIIVFCFVSYFFVDALKTLFGKKKRVKKNVVSSSVVGLFSGFLQGAGLAGSDLRNNYLYAKRLSLVEVHGTTALMGGSNFLIATLIRLFTNQLPVTSLVPVLYLSPVIVLGVWMGRYALYRVNNKYMYLCTITIMGLTVVLLGWRIISS